VEEPLKPSHLLICKGYSVQDYYAFLQSMNASTKFTLGALMGLMVENREMGMVKIGFK
jgi:hypothetical protein